MVKHNHSPEHYHPSPLSFSPLHHVVNTNKNFAHESFGESKWTHRDLCQLRSNKNTKLSRPNTATRIFSSIILSDVAFDWNWNSKSKRNFHSFDCFYSILVFGAISIFVDFMWFPLRRCEYSNRRKDIEFDVHVRQVKWIWTEKRKFDSKVQSSYWFTVNLLIVFNSYW